MSLLLGQPLIFQQVSEGDLESLTTGFDVGCGRLSALPLPRLVDAVPDLRLAESTEGPSSRPEAGSEALNLDLEFPPLLAARQPSATDKSEQLSSASVQMWKVFCGHTRGITLQGASLPIIRKHHGISIK